MKTVEITAQLGKEANSPKVAVTVQMPESLAEAAKTWGEDVVFGKAKQSVVIDMQALMRRGLAKTKTPAEIQTAVNAYKPTTSGEVVRKTAQERVQEDIGKLDTAAKEALLKQLQAQIAAQKQAPRAAA